MFRRVVMAAVDLFDEYIKWPAGEYHKSLSKRLPTLSVVQMVCFLFKYTSPEKNYLRSVRLLKMKGDFLQ